MFHVFEQGYSNLITYAIILLLNDKNSTNINIMHE